MSVECSSVLGALQFINASSFVSSVLTQRNNSMHIWSHIMCLSSTNLPCSCFTLQLECTYEFHGVKYNAREQEEKKQKKQAVDCVNTLLDESNSHICLYLCTNKTHFIISYYVCNTLEWFKPPFLKGQMCLHERNSFACCCTASD